MAINKYVDEQIQEAKARLEAQEKDIPQPNKRKPGSLPSGDKKIYGSS